MRDVLLTLLVFGLLPFILRAPVVGAYTWAWLAMMSPQRSVYGFAYSLPFAYIVALVTLLGLVFSSKRQPVPVSRITALLFLLLVWMTVTSFFALTDAPVVWDRWIFVMKIQLMLFVTLMLVRGRKQIEWLIWVVTFSVGIYGIKGGLWTIANGGSGRVWGPQGGMIEGNNELGVALIMLLPLMFYLYQTTARRILRFGLLVSMISTSFAVLGTQSRGALLGLAAIAVFLALKSQRPIRMSIVAGALLVSAISFMPASWTSRMDTIQTYAEDNSAMSRIFVWKTMWAAAVDRPLVGAGFAADSPIVFRLYAPREREFEYLEDAVLVAHSIYFQMLGEHGFPGLIIFLLLWAATWRAAGRVSRRARDDPEFGAWVPRLMMMIQVSIVGYAVGGAFLSLAYFDLPYYLIAVVVLVDATIRQRDRAAAGTHDRTADAAALAHPLRSARS
jgi:putative inorganic carbon (HCO3(-)) transporter